MLLSEILQKFDEDLKYKIINERSFDTLSLAVMNTSNFSLTFIDTPKFIDSIRNSVSMIITTPECEKELVARGFGVCVVTSPREVFFKLHNYLAHMEEFEYERGYVENNVSSSANISPLSSISSHNVTIGNNATIEPFVTIHKNTIVGNNCIIRSGSVIGSEGFEFKEDQEGLYGVTHCGGVILEDGVEIQHNTCVDKALYPWDNTIIGKNSKLDNLVHVGHAVKIGENVLVVAQVGIGGRTIIENNCWIGFGATLRNGIKIGHNARVNMGAVVTKDVASGEAVTGNFAIPHELFIERLKN